MEDVLSKDFVEKLTSYIQKWTLYAKNYQNVDVSMMDDSFIVLFLISLFIIKLFFCFFV